MHDELGAKTKINWLKIRKQLGYKLFHLCRLTNSSELKPLKCGQLKICADI